MKCIELRAENTISDSRLKRCRTKHDPFRTKPTRHKLYLQWRNLPHSRILNLDLVIVCVAILNISCA